MALQIFEEPLAVRKGETPAQLLRRFLRARRGPESVCRVEEFPRGFPAEANGQTAVAAIQGLL